jgi:hypothetical protein
MYNNLSFQNTKYTISFSIFSMALNLKMYLNFSMALNLKMYLNFCEDLVVVILRVIYANLVKLLSPNNSLGQIPRIE